MKHSKAQLKIWAKQFLFNPYSDKAANVVITLSRRFNITPQQVVNKIILLAK